jgi:hypothetical protein
MSKSPTPRTDGNKHAIAHLERYGFENSLDDPVVEWPILCEEIERELAEAKFDLQFRRELYALQTKELAAVKQIMGELCDCCGWAMRLPDQPCRCELERELANLKESVASLSHPNCRDLLRERDEARGQRDRLAEALRELCETLLKDKPRDITDLLNKAGDALAAVKGGGLPNNCQRPELCLLTETCIPCAICPHAVKGGSHD